MDTIVIKGRLATPQGIRRGALTIEEGRIARVAAEGAAGRTFDFGEALVSPGFVDVHLHGAGPFRMFEAEDIAGAAEFLVRFGVTGFLPTASNLSAEEYAQFGRNARAAQSLFRPGSARVLGAHFEGPFINPDRCGGMDPARLRPPDAEECLYYLEAAPGTMKLMTLSPELPGAEKVIRLLANRGVVASLGHSLAGEREIGHAVAAGARQVCHLFNVFMRPAEFGEGTWTEDSAVAFLEQRRLDCEVICDLHHVAHEHVRMAAAALGPDRFLAITDAARGAGLPPGEYPMKQGGTFHTRDGAARRTSDGALIGSVITLDRAFANLVEHCGVDEATAVRYAATNPARAAGARDAGTLEPGKRADVAVLDRDHACIAAFAGGVPAHLG